MINPLSNVLYSLPPLVAFGIGLTLAILVLKRDAKSFPNRLFSLVLLSLSLWGLFIFLMRSSPSTELALFWDKMAVPAGIAMFVFHYHFVSIYTNSRANKTIKLAYALLASTIAFSAAGLLISRMSLESYGYAPIFTPYMYAITAGGTVAMVGALINLVKASSAATHHKYKTRIAYMIIAIVILFSFGILDVFPSLPPFGIFGNIIFGILTGVAILRYHLLDVNIALRRGLAYLLMSALVAIPYVSTFHYFQNIANRNVPLQIIVTLLVFTAIVFNPLWRRVEGFVNRSFYRHRYDFLKALEGFIKESHDIRDIEQLCSSLVTLTSKAIDASNIRLLLPNEMGEFTTKCSADDASLPCSIRNDGPIINWLRSNGEPLYYQDIASLPVFRNVDQRELRNMEIAGVEILVPLQDKKDDLVGLLVLGKRPSKRPYTYEDERLVKHVADRMAIELENAQLYEQVRCSEVALRESETLFRTIVESSPSFLMIVGKDGTVIYASPNCEQFTGYNQQELQGKITWWVHDDDLARITEACYGAFGKGVSSGENVQFRATKKDGEHWYASASWRLLKDQEGEARSLVVQVVDVTERRRMERERIKIEERAYASNRLTSIGEMAAGIAHEINNPLTSVIGFSQILMKKNIPEDMKDIVVRVNDGAQRVADIVRRLLTFARKKKPERVAINLNDVIEDTLALREYELKTNNVELTTKLDPNLPLILADTGQLQQVFLNIIINAETALKSVRRRGKLLIRTATKENTVKAMFRDNGLGIPKENLQKIFEPFFTTGEIGQGTGLGLSLCHGIVTEHNGKIYAESTLGKGTEFTVELPVGGRLVEKSSEPQAPTEQVGDIRRTKRAKILVVDDEESILHLLSNTLVEEGYIVETADNAEDALQRLNGRKYEAILLDIRLPGMSGIELYNILEDMDKSLVKRVILITGDILDSSTEAFMSSRKATYLTKPFDENLLKEELRRRLKAAEMVNM